MENWKYPPAVSDLEGIHQGKVRDTFAIPEEDDKLFLVATDRISSHEEVHESTIPKKGYALTALTVFWSEILAQYDIKTHIIAHGEEIFKYIPLGVTDDPYDLAKRALVVEKLDMIPIEFIFRARMAGSLWKKYYSKGLQNPYGLTLPEGMQLMEAFPQPIFTPTGKSDAENDPPVLTKSIIAKYEDAYQLVSYVYEVLRYHALAYGIDPIDTKFELGFDKNGRVVLGDEILTPDSSRFVSLNDIVIGKEPPWKDKQFIRNEAERIWGNGPKTPLTFSPEIVQKTTAIYEDLCFRLTGVRI